MSEHCHPSVFIADSKGLDFLNARWRSGAGLLAWLDEARLISSEVLAHMRTDVSERELDAVAAEGVRLREWLRNFVRAHKGKPLTGDVLGDLGPLNALLQQDQMFPQIVGADDDTGEAAPSSALKNESLRRLSGPSSLLFPIADVIVDLICREDFSMVKSCEGPTCSLVFLDKTKRHARRWCSMAWCGNRAKQAAHRARGKDEAENA
jgi:predicted RNA-binding Zn ribbon-like protein